MDNGQAFKIDEDFDVKYDRDRNLYVVVGRQSKFRYRSFFSCLNAIEHSISLQDQKALHTAIREGDVDGY